MCLVRYKVRRPSWSPHFHTSVHTCFMEAGLRVLQRFSSGTVLASRHMTPATTGEATLVPAGAREEGTGQSSKQHCALHLDTRHMPPAATGEATLVPANEEDSEGAVDQVTTLSYAVSRTCTRMSRPPVRPLSPSLDPSYTHQTASCSRQSCATQARPSQPNPTHQTVSCSRQSCPKPHHFLGNPCLPAPALFLPPPFPLLLPLPLTLPT